ncbi:hypothetical protein Tco_0949211 [Tanacetum coccineum]
MYQVFLDALALTTCYPAFLITANVPVIYMQQFWVTINKHGSSYQFKICPRLPDHEFDEPPSKEEILSFIKELGHTGNIKNITTVVVDHMHQPWRTFALIINKCLSGKIIDFSFQIDNRDAKKQEKMYYPRFTKAIIHHFLSKDKSISMRNKMFIHTAQDDSILGILRFVSKDEDTQVYGALIPVVMTTPKIRDSPAYQTYLTFATRAATPKSKKIYKKPASSMIKTTTTSPEETPSKRKDTPSVSVSKKKAPTTTDRSKGIDLLSEAALLEDAQMKKVPDELQDKIIEDDDSNDDDSDDDGNDDGNDDDSNDDEEEYKDEYVCTRANYESTDDEKEHVNEEEYDRIDEELFKDVNVEITDVGHDDVTQETTYDQVEDDAHVTPTSAHVTQKTEVPLQSSSVSSDFASQFLNLDNVPPTDNEIISMMNVDVHHKDPSNQTPLLLTIPVTVIPETSTAATTTIPLPIPLFTPIPQLSIPTPTPTPIPTNTSIPALLDFSSVFQFNQRVSNLEKELPKIKQADQSAQLLATIKSKIHEAQAEKKRHIDLIEKSVKDIINDEVKTQLPQILPKAMSDFATSVIQSTVTKSLEDDLFLVYCKAISLKRGHKDKDKDEDPPAGSDQGMKRRKTSKDVELSKSSKSKESKSKSSSKGTTRSQPKSSGKSAQAKEPIHIVDDTEVQQNKGQDMGYTNDQPNVEGAPKHDWFKKPERPSTPDSDWNIDNLTQDHLVGPVFNLLKGTCKSHVELKYNIEECYKAVTDRLDWNNPEGKKYPFDLSKPLPLIMDRGRQVVPDDYFINNDLEYLRGESSSKKYTTSTTKTKAAKYDIQGIEDIVPSL